MSGICGVVHFDKEPVDHTVLSQMTGVVEFRGPDGIYYWQDEMIELAYLALNTSSEELTQSQPFVAHDIVVVADVRLDNRSELLPLLSNYYQSEIPSDVELISSAYRCWGKDCATHLIGDFVFVLWDKRKQCILAARDPMGLRAVYYWHHQQKFVFATEIQQLLRVPYIPQEIYEPSIAIYLSGPFKPQDWTFYEGIKQLAPGHSIKIDTNQTTVWQHWDANPCKTIRYRRDSEYAEHFLDIFKEAVICRVQTPYPVGLSLSGGWDSGGIASAIGWLFQNNKIPQIPFNTYSYAFDELTSSDERHISREITNHYQLNQIDVPADQLWPLKDYPLYGPNQDDPYISPYQTLYDSLFALAQSKGKRILMSGFRGDEIAGSWYVDYVGMLLNLEWKTLWHELNAMSKDQGLPLTLAVRNYLIPPFHHSIGLLGKVRTSLRGKQLPSYAPWILAEFAERVSLSELLSVELQEPQNLQRYGWYQRHRQIFSTAAIQVAIHAERREAQFGISHIDPWSDRRLAEFVLAIPQSVVNRYSEPKRITRHAMKPIMPEKLIQQPSKIIPSALYFRGVKDRSKSIIFDLIDNSVAAEMGYLNKHILYESYERYLDGITPQYEMWWALSLEIWLQKYFC